MFTTHYRKVTVWSACLIVSPFLCFIGSTDPCFSGNHHIVIGGDYSLYNMSAEKTTHKIPVNQWFLPKDLSGRCQNVLAKNTSDLCVIVSIYGMGVMV